MKFSGKTHISSINPIFEALRYPPMSSDQGYNSLKDLTLMGVPPTRLYFGDGYSGTTWVDVTGNDNLTLQAGNPTLNILGPVPSVLGVKGDGTAYFSGSSGPTTGTNDFIIALALRLDNNKFFASTYSSSAGWQIFTDTDPALYCQLRGAATPYNSITPILNQNIVLVWCVNRDENSTNGGFCFVNSIASSGKNFSGASASITDDGPFTLLAREDGVSPSSATMYAAGIWLGPNIFSAGATGAAQMQAVATELTQRFSGVFPQRASAGNELLTVTRATEEGTVIERNGVKNVFHLGNGLQGIDDEGLLIQGATTNRCDYSYNISDWDTKTAVTADLNATGPDGIINGGSTITDDGNYSYHYFSTDVGTLAVQWYEVAILGKNLYPTIPWLRVVLLTGTWSDYGGYYFNFVNGTIGLSLNNGSAVVENPIVENWGNNIYCCRFFFYSVNDSMYFQNMFSKTGDGTDPAYNDDVVPLMEVYAAQVCGGKYRHSIVRTNGAQATRNALDINIDPDNIPSGDFTITGEFKLPAITLEDHYTAWEFSDGTSDNRFHMGFDAYDGYAHITIETGGTGYVDYNLPITGNLADDEWHTFMISHQNGIKAFLKVDTYSTVANHGKTLPTITTAYLGRDLSDRYLNGKIRNIKIYDRYIEEPPTISASSLVFESLRHPPMLSDQGYNSLKDLSVMGVMPSRLFCGDNAASIWADKMGNDNLTLQAGSPTYNILGASPSVLGVKGNGTAWWRGSSGPITGTQDLIVAVALTWGGSTGTRIIAGTRPSTGGAGWSLYTINANSGLYLWLGDGTQNVNQVSTSILIAGQTVVACFTINVSETGSNCAFAFINGIAGSGATPTGALGSVTDTSALTLGAYSNGNSPIGSGDVIYAAAVWQAADIFSAGAAGAAQMQAVATELTQRFSGVFPQRASDGNELLTVTRATEGVVEIERSGVTKYFRQGNGLQCVDDEGLEIYGAIHNSIDYSCTNAGWVDGSASTITNSTIEGPITGVNWVKCVEIASTSWHGGYFWTTDTIAQNQKVLIQALIKAGSRRWVNLRIGTENADTAGICVDTNDGSITDTGTAGSGVLDDWGVEAKGDGVYLVWLIFHSTRAGSQTFYPFIAISDSAILSAADYDSFAGDPTTYPNGIYWSGVMAVIGQTWGPLPFVYTNGAHATRNALDANIDANNIPSGDFTITGEFKLPDITTPNADGYMFDLNDGTANNRLALFANDTDGYVSCLTVGGGSLTLQTLSGVGNVFDDSWHTFLVAYEDGITCCKIDAVTDTSNHGDTIGTRSAMELGRAYDETNYLNGKVRNIRIYSSYRESI